MADGANSSERLSTLEQSLETLRKRVDQQVLDLEHARRRLRHGLLTCTIAGVMIALTATTWRVENHEGLTAADVQTLWGMTPEGWPPVAALLLVLALGIGTIVMALTSSGRAAHLVFALLGLLTSVAVLFAGSLKPTFGLDASHYESGPGRWLTLLCALGLACLFGARASALR